MTPRAGSVPNHAESGQSEPGGARVEELLRAAPAFVTRLNAALEVEYVNRVVPGIEPASVVGRRVHDFIEAAYHGQADAAFERARMTGESQRFQVGGVGPNQLVSFYDVFVAPLEGGPSRGFVMLSFDVTERATREHALMTSAEQLRLTVENTGIGLWSFDPTSGAVQWSQRMHAILGQNEPLGMEAYLTQAVHPDDRERVAANMADIDRRDDVWVQHRIVRNGEVRWVAPSGVITRGSDGRAIRVVGGLLDVTEVRELEHRAQQAERLQAVATLASGVAHNLNNFMAVVRPSLELLHVHLGPEGRTLLADARKATDRAAKLVRQLMTFARQRGARQLDSAPLDTVVSEVVEAFRESNPAIQVHDCNEANGAHVACDAQELREVLQSLLNNARDALLSSEGPGPRVEVTLRCVRSGDASATQADFAEIIVHDNGPGIDDATKEHVFDPFFTTKGPQLGLGLGLAISWSLVNASGGTLTCDSALGVGTVFTVMLPLATDVRAPQPPSVDKARFKGARILLVEDDPLVRRATRRTLAVGRHVVQEAASAAEALRHASNSTYDLVLLDQWLPDGRGTEIIERLRTLIPGVRVVLFTGQDLDDQQAASANALLSKPLGTQELLDSLQSLLEVSNQ